MSEMALTADHIIVVGRGRVLADAPVSEIVGRAAGGTVRVCSPQASRLADLLAGPGVSITSPVTQQLEVSGSTAQAIGEAAAAARIVLHELTPLTGSLEDAYMSLTQDSVEYRSSTDALDPGPVRDDAPTDSSHDTQGQTR
jgi:ABC-2 type transport system ATP-binding protein